MQTIRDGMKRDAKRISAQDAVQRAAEMMDDLNVGAIPVLDGGRLVGMITDWDIAAAPDRLRGGMPMGR